MKATFLLISLGFIGYTLFNKFYQRNLLPSIQGGTNISQGSSNINFDSKTEAQIARGEGLTDESKTGIND